MIPTSPNTVMVVREVSLRNSFQRQTLTDQTIPSRDRPSGVTPDDYVRSEVGVSNVQGGNKKEFWGGGEMVFEEVIDHL